MNSSKRRTTWLAALVLGLALGCGDAPLSDERSRQNAPDELGYTVSADMGYTDLPQAYVHVGGSPQEDYCRFVGDHDRPHLSCKIWQNGWEGEEYLFNAVDDLDLGYAAFPREFGDVNGDGLGDYCRFVGDWGEVFLSCNLAGPTSFEADQYGFNSEVGIDLGYSDMPRTLRDRNGDGLLDFCRFVGDHDDPSECCLQANVKRGGFGPNQYICYSGPLVQYIDPHPVAIGGGGGGRGGSGGTTKPKPDADPACECTICGGSCGGCAYDSCDATHGCGPGSACIQNNEQRRFYCVPTCAQRECWAPSDVGACKYDVELPPFTPPMPGPLPEPKSEGE